MSNDEQAISSPVTFSYEKMRLQTVLQAQLGDAVSVNDANELMVTKPVTSSNFRKLLDILTKDSPMTQAKGLMIDNIIIRSSDMSPDSNPIVKAYSLAKDSLVKGTPLVQEKQVTSKVTSTPKPESASERKGAIQPKTGGVDTATVMKLVEERRLRVEALKLESEKIRNGGEEKGDEQSNKPK